MRIAFLVAAMAIAGCGGAAQCSNMVSCGAGAYSACSDGAGCWLAASDGSRFQCKACGDCAAATMAALSWCSPRGVGGNGNGGAGGSGGGGSGGGGGGSGGGGGTGALDGGVGMQDPACAAWLTCAATYDPNAFASQQATYGPSGSCWSSTPSAAMSCATACTTSLGQAAADPGSPASCKVGAPTAITLSGDAASGFGPPQTIAAFRCVSDGVEATIANHFASPSWISQQPLTLHIRLDTIEVYTINGIPGTNHGGYTPLYVSPYDFGISGGSAGSLAKPIMLAAQAPAMWTPGTLTVSGGWKCN